MAVQHKTINDVFLHVVDNFARDDQYLVLAEDRVVKISTAEVYNRVKLIASALIGAGIVKGDRVALISENRVDWPIWDFAILAVGAVNVPFYTSLPSEQLFTMMDDCGAKLVFSSDKTQTGKVLSIKEKLPGLSLIVNDSLSDKESVMTVDEFTCSFGNREFRDSEFRAFSAKASSDDLAIILYTSGTTGIPKGVMLSHGNLASDINASSEVIKVRPDDTGLSALPLCHSFQRMVDYVLFANGASICHVPNPAMVMTYIKDIHPTVIASVPRFQEKMYAGILKGFSNAGRIVSRIAEWSLKTAEKWSEAKLSGKKPSFFLKGKYKLADSLILSKVRASLGGKFRFFISGGGPLPAELCRIFYGMGITIIEGYGLTETSPVVCLNENDICPGSVGRPVPGIEVKLAEDGELMVKGPVVMMGYYNKPEETAKIIDKGWLLTGDLAEIDAEGRVSITGRKKELIVLSNGKNVYPQPVENMLLQIEAINQAVVFGDNQKFIAALIVPDREVLSRISPELDLAGKSFQDAAASEAFRKYLKGKLNDLNENLPDYERIRKFSIITEEFSMTNECMTPTLKLRRNRIAEIHRENLSKLFQSK